MTKVVIKQSELPIPVSDHINKIQFRVVNENRNIFSDWSVINFVKQNTLLPNNTDILPPITDPGDVLIVLPQPDDNWEVGWSPITPEILPDDIV